MKTLKYIMILIGLIALSYVDGTTRTVALDGTQQYTSIQVAINASSNGDSVLVYPGRYIENINFNSKNITLASLYARNPLQTYIDNTIVDGNLNTCIKVSNGETVCINGLTFVNNEQHLNTYTNIYGGIRTENESNVSIYNCVIRNCSALTGAGICSSTRSNLFLSNTQIFDNRADRFGGGITFGGAQITFDATNPCSVYNNFACFGMDIVISYTNYHATLQNINLAIGSLSLSTPDNYFIYVDNANVTVNIQQGYLTQVDHDLYVSPDGNDNNSGLTTATPMKTIAIAMQKIVSNPMNPHTIHLAAGTYSFSDNNQILPIALKSNVKITGAGSDNTIIDAEMRRGFFGSFSNSDIEISGTTLTNMRDIYRPPIDFQHCRCITLRDLKFINNQGAQHSGINLNTCNNVIIEDLYVGDVIFPKDMSSVYIGSCRNVYINQLVTSNCVTTNTEANFIGPVIFDSDVIIRNSIIANNTGIDSFVFCYQNIYPNNADCTLDMSNVLFYNNTVPQCDWVFCPIYLQNRLQPIHVNNCTIANNTTNGSISQIFGFAEVNNLITYNPRANDELKIDNHIFDMESQTWIDAEVNIRNSLFRTGSVYSTLPELVTFTDNIFNGNPLFEGMVNDTLEASDPAYYRLSASSPCINAGVADTTGMNLPVMDLAGNYRIWDNRIDMGCYEYGSEPVGNDDPVYPVQPDKITLSTYPNPVYLNGKKGAYTFIEFTLPEKAKAKPVIEIYNLKGQKVRTMQAGESLNSMARKAGIGEAKSPLPQIRNGFTNASSNAASAESAFGSPNNRDGRLTNKQDAYATESYSTVWDCRDDRSQTLASGIYIVKVTSGRLQTSSKLTILK